MSGVVTGVKPPFLATNYIAQLQSASSSIAASFFKNTNLDPVSFEALLKSRRSNLLAISK